MQTGHGRNKFVDDSLIWWVLCTGYGVDQFLSDRNLVKCRRSTGHDNARKHLAWHSAYPKVPVASVVLIEGSDSLCNELRFRLIRGPVALIE